MNYKELETYIKDKMRDAGAIENFNEYRRYEFTHVETINNIEWEINFPGKKSTSTKPDYVFKYKGVEVSHQTVVMNLHKVVKFDNTFFSTLEDFLYDSYMNAINFSLDGYTECDDIMSQMNDVYNLQELQVIIAIIAVQEEINYPQRSGYKGRKMPYYRYLESLYSGMEDQVITIKDVIERTNTRGYRPELKREINYNRIFNRA
ncbi:hypothetical protein KHQ82_00395 [Mycoplasmatota bacterium]|nr:hypothetical protein KHQ82_00395 [Mycoplasmatota bacterium]